MAYPSDPYHNTYSCPNCEADVEVPLPLPKYAMCKECKARLQINVDAEFYGGMWHDRTELDFADEPDPEREHIEKIIEHSKRIVDGCEHKYAEQETAPLGVKCIKCGHFVGAWE